MSHYYDENPEVKSDEKQITYECYQHSINLITDNGVFSRDKVDFGSDLLIQTFLKANPPGPSKTIADVG
ncbi:methyltransferase, partial [Bacillaceae bacterium HSR45]|nr:methyltransferase [Bacillaceae bacterium HSR45]